MTLRFFELPPARAGGKSTQPQTPSTPTAMATTLVSARTPLHPGRFLDSRFLAPSGMSQTDAARRLGISRRRLNELIGGKRGISPDTAIRLACVFGQDAQFWMALQSAWDLAQARRQLRQARRV